MLKAGENNHKTSSQQKRSVSSKLYQQADSFLLYPFNIVYAREIVSMRECQVGTPGNHIYFLSAQIVFFPKQRGHTEGVLAVRVKDPALDRGGRLGVRLFL